MTGHLKLTVFTGERDRIEGRATCDTVMRLLHAAGVDAAVLLRGVMGFGVKHRLRTDRVLSLSEDLPMATVAVAPAALLHPLAVRIADMLTGGLVTLERVVVVDPGHIPVPGHAHTKLTVYLAEGGVAATQAVRDADLDGAIVYAGLDGVLGGVRRRARLLRPDRGVPAMLVSMGPSPGVQAALARFTRRERAVTTLERVHVLRRDGVHRGDPPPVSAQDSDGLGRWQRITVIAAEHDLHRGIPIHDALIAGLRGAGADGATVLRGIWGFSHSGAPHGDRLFALRRRTPTLLTLVDRPARVEALWPIIARATATAGLVTCETLPAVHTIAPGHRAGGLSLAEPPA